MHLTLTSYLCSLVHEFSRDDRDLNYLLHLTLHVLDCLLEHDLGSNVQNEL